MIRAVFFDAAGTLFDARQPVADIYAALARQHGVEADPRVVDAAFRRAFSSAPGLAFGPGRDSDELRRLERLWWQERVADTFRGLGTFDDFESYFNELFATFADPATWSADPEAIATLRRLKEQGMVLGVISNFDYRLYGVLDGLGLAAYFDSVTISSEAGWAKPSPAVFEAALRKHAVEAAQTVHIGDSLSADVGGATAVGIAAVLIDRDGAHRGELPARAARVQTLGALPDMLQRFA
jgi:putative hydrolase of the HAD superfamily